MYSNTLGRVVYRIRSSFRSNNFKFIKKSLACTGKAQSLSCPAYQIVLCNASLSTLINWSWWRHQMETISALLAICAWNSPVTGQWRVALMFSLICAWINDWVNSREPGDLRRHYAHYDVIVMFDNIITCILRYCSGACVNNAKRL